MNGVILVRHAPPLLSGTCAGRSDVAVEPAPAAAEVVLQALGTLSQKPTRVVSSPSARCHELARELALRLGLSLTLDQRLLELDFGEWEGRTWEEIERVDRQRFERWMAHWHDEAPPGGESIAELEHRVAAWLGESTGNLAVTHAGVIRAARVLCHGQAWETALAEAVLYLVPIRMAFGSPGSAA